MSFNVRVTLAELGADPANGERFIEALLATTPEADPVVSQNLDRRTLTISVACDAPDATAAVRTATDLIRGVVGGQEPTAVAVRPMLPDAA